jgi:hypothetical protein
MTRFACSARYPAVVEVAVVFIVTLIGVGAVVKVIAGEVQLIPYCDGKALFTFCPFTVVLTLEQMKVTRVPTTA